ncbi:Lysophospholipid transporter LplT [Caulifigura coniformis]|uniref:Lysophospholipid transporter LplT n=1 Tax=Caulifigura coniformis TaxID=2527983 RepID=A0A517SKL9_9PLAN|nr:MFS transporter [Caulifigura coniformis]QDT56672.1 Lysophospholipid transporter LplT [Caulifigura coniformis]
MSEPAALSSKPWSKDPSFWCLTATQFCGALNDNIFKQLVMLLCIDVALGDPDKDQQFLAQVLFSAPFILLSGFAGYLADRHSKRSIIVLCKLAEIAIALGGMVAFGFGGLTAALLVLALMGTHSAFFGPPKYGVLPELFHEHDLPKVNGIILMTTFLAIILAFPTAGALKIACDGHLWMASIACVVLAVIGTLTALPVRKTPIARPDLTFEPATLFIHPSTWSVIKQQKGLLVALLASSAFWLTGGVVYPMVINSVGKLQFGLDDFETGKLAACTGIGITVGCVTAGILSKNQFRAGLVKLGMWGMLATLAVLSIPGSGMIQRELSPAEIKKFGGVVEKAAPAGEAAPEAEKVIREFRPMWLGVYGAGALLILLGISAGLFSVPVQVYLQARAPAEQKGRIIGVMNLFNWIGIAAAGPFWKLCNSYLGKYQAPNLLFAAAALGVIPLLILYRPKDEQLA